MSNFILELPDTYEEYDYSITDYYLDQDIPQPTEHFDLLAIYRDMQAPTGDYTIKHPTLKKSTRALLQDPKASELRASAKKMYSEANDHYIKTQGHVLEHIKINSGRRSILEQAGFYESYLESLYGGAVAPRANKPGRSYHEYGLAIDIIRGGDEDRLKKSLSKAGWVQAIADEGWHFQAESAIDWGEVTQKIETSISPLSEKYAEDRVVYFENRKRVTENEPIYKQEKKRLDDERGSLNNDRANLDQERIKLQNKQMALNAEDSSIKTERSRVQQLKSNYFGMSYNRCPQNASYEECTHSDLKRQYDSERSSALDKYQKAARDLATREQNQVAERKKWNDDTISYRNKFQHFQERWQKYDQDRILNEELGKKINTWRAERDTRNSLKADNLNKIILAAAKI